MVAEAPSRRTRALGLLVATLAALGIAEMAAGAARGYAYPFLNIFEADPHYGVRLEANATTRTRSPFGRVTVVETNEHGFRGPSLLSAPADSPEALRVLVLGDSQVFGYGVAYHDALGARLEHALGEGARVRSLAVPTWGPTEYVKALEEHASAARPNVVVFVANAANDWFETNSRNAQRTTARDGWALRPQKEASQPLWFPGRGLLFGRSHLWLASRELFAHAAGSVIPRPQAARQLVEALKLLRRGASGSRSPMTPSVLATRDVCEVTGCRVIVATLPLDVQVDAREWGKYNTRARDLRRTEDIFDDLLADAALHDIEGVNLLPVLRAVSPGAFLPDDYHLSPRGHDAVARALCDQIRPTVALNGAF